MGIKGFAAWLRATFPHVFCPIPNGSTGNKSQQLLHFDQVYVDLNPFLHMAARQSSNLDELIRSFRKSLKNAVSNTARPGSLVYVSMDGPAPLAKLPEQRSRRQDAAINAARRGTFDAQQLTPGCLAMTTIEAQAYSTIRELFFQPASAAQKASQSSSFQAIIDGTGVEGEGEFKILRKILTDHVDEDALKGRVTRAILACDADLFLQALLSEVPHLYLLDPFAPYQSPTTVFSVDRWRRSLSAESQGSGESRLMAFDFVLFALMSGSDYLQALRYANYRSLWPAYLEFVNRADGRVKRAKISASERENRTNTIVDPVSKSINFSVMRDFFAFYLEEKLGETLRESLNAFHAELNPSTKNERILDYAEHLIWNLDALATCNVPDLSISLQTEKQIPSLIELAELDAEVLQEMLEDRLKHPKRADSTEKQCKYPGVMALMALDRSTDCEEYLATPLRPLMRDLKDESSDLGRIQEDSILVKDLRARIDSIGKTEFSMVENMATFPRDPIVLNKESAAFPEGSNFYSMALKSANCESESRLLDEPTKFDLPWIRPYVHTLSEEESWKCPLHRLLFSKYRVNKC